jgi:hypothetical protein
MAEFTARLVAGFVAVVILIAFLGSVAADEAWYKALKDWQTGLGALAGLLAILVGALKNAQLTRQRDKDLRDEEAMRLARALYAEVRYLRISIIRRLDIATRLSAAGTPLTVNDVFNLQIRYPLVYPNAVQHVGLLPDDVLVDLVSLYARAAVTRQHYEAAREEHVLVGEPLGKAGVEHYEILLQLADAVLPRLKKAARLA